MVWFGLLRFFDFLFVLLFWVLWIVVVDVKVLCGGLRIKLLVIIFVELVKIGDELLG